MNAIEKAVVARIVKDDESREAVAGINPGEYKGEFLAKVSYAFKRGEDFEKPIPAKAKPWRILAYALGKLNGVTIDALVREVEDAGIDEADIEKRANAAMAEISAKTITKCNGQVRGTFSLEVLPALGIEVK
jgi:hypothetical protein